MSHTSGFLDAAFRKRLARNSLPPAVVIGTEVTGFTIARALAKHNVPVLAVDSQRRRYTGYSSAFQLVLTRDYYGEAFVDFLVQLAQEIPCRATLFISKDEHVKLVGAAPQLKSLYTYEYPQPSAVDLLMNKDAFVELAGVRGWEVPGTYSCASEADVRAAIPLLTFPVVLKPRTKNLAFRAHSPQKVFRCDTPEDLVRDYRLIAQWETDAIVQEWIPGGDDEIYFSFHYLDASLNEIASFEGKKIRQWLPLCGSTALAVGVAHPRVTELSRHILKETGCAGFGAVEYKRDARTDRFVIMEPTVGRVNLQIGVAVANGTDIISRAYFHLIGQAYPGALPVTSNVKWVYGRSDFKSARFYMARGELTWMGYLQSLRGRKHFAVWSHADASMLAALARHILALPFRILGRALRRATRAVQD